MAFLISTPANLCSSCSTSSSSSFSTQIRKPAFSAVCSYAISVPKPLNFRFYSSICGIGVSPLPQWSRFGRHLGISISRRSLKLGRKSKGKRKGVYASLFGVGAPEALVIGVVALLVFGPKGLAEVARNLGKTLRAFQPTIRELQDVSREFKSTLEREIGIDEIQSSTQNYTYRPPTTNTTPSPSSSNANTDTPQNAVDPNGSPSSNKAYSSEELLKITEEQLKATTTEQKMESESQTRPQDTDQEAAAAAVPLPRKPENEI